MINNITQRILFVILDTFIQVDKVFRTSRSFFEDLPFEIKNRHPLNLETMDGYSFPWDVYSPKTKQNYDFTSPETPLPDEHAPELRPSVNHLASHLVKLTNKLLDFLSLALGIVYKYNFIASRVHLLFYFCFIKGLQEDYLSSRHKLMFCGAHKNATVLASLHYEPLTEEKIQEINGIWAGEHTDNGTVTLILQDEIGGLEVNGGNKRNYRTKLIIGRDSQVKVDGEWTAADPIPGTIVLLASDVIQMWTADRYKASVHRVVVPADEAKRRSVRQSLVYFVDPDNGVRVAPLDGSDKYPPFVAPEYQKRRQQETGYISTPKRKDDDD